MGLKFRHIRQELVEIGKKISQMGLVLGTWGNVSTRIYPENLVAISPSGMDYDIITADHIVITNLSGDIIDGMKKPSIELNLHLEIYKNRNDVNAIIHTHSEYCTALAIARKGIPPAIEDLVQIAGGNIRVSEYHLPGSNELAKAVVKALESRNAVILANHGCLSVAKDLKEALKVSLIVEKSAKATIFAQIMGGIVELSKEDIDLMRDFYLNKYGQK